MFILKNTDYKNREYIKPDYSYSLLQIYDYLYTSLHQKLYCINQLSDDYENLIEGLVNQVNIHLKNDYLAFVLVHEFNIAKKAGVLSGTNESEIFKQFILYTNTGEWIEYICEKYPLLKTLIENFINNLITYLELIAQRFYLDHHEICKENEHEKIKGIELFLGDFHQHNKFVLKIELSSSRKVYYKPRRFNNELIFLNFIKFLNSLGADINVAVPSAINKDDYCWVNHLHNDTEFNNEQEIAEYYCTQGKLLAVFHLLGTTDIIPDNIMISEKKPGLFDLESLITKPRYSNTESLRYAFDESVIKVGMLPEWMIGNNFDRSVLSSTFFIFNQQKINQKIWRDKDSFAFEYSDEITNFSAKDEMHLPKLFNAYQELNPTYLNFLSQGFINTYRLISRHKEKLNVFIKQQDFKQITYRVILHPTSIYTLLLKEITIPEYLRGSKSISTIVKSMVDIGTTDNFKFDQDMLSTSIENQIWNLDVPYFYADLNNGTLKDGLGNVVSDQWNFDPYAYLHDKLENFNDDNLRFQLAIIVKSNELAFEYFDKPFFGNQYINSKNFFTQLDNNSQERNVIQKQKLLDGAIKIGEYFNNNFFEFDGKINWISKVRDPLDGRYHISLLDYDLYDGLSGVGLLYAYLHKYTTEEHFKINGLKIYNQLTELSLVRHENAYYINLPDDIVNHYPVSPYSYPASYLYLTTHYYAIFGANIINLNAIDAVLDALEQLLIKCQNFEYLLGASGLLDFMLKFRKETFFSNMQKVDRIINKCIQILNDNAVINDKGASWSHIDEGEIYYLGGFAHGTAGISYSLYAAAKHYNKELEELGDLALKFDRTFFDEDERGWLDKRDLDNIFDSNAWCHGSGGIALGRLLSSQYSNSEEFAHEIQIASTNLVTDGLHGNQCVCHGDMGNLEILTASANYLSDTEIANKVQTLIEKILTDYENKQTFKYGDGGKLEILGLFIGLAGIGYQFLRFYDWQNTPSILCLETPKTLNYVLH